MVESNDKHYSAPALEKGLDILEFLAGQSVPCSKIEIAAALERTPSEIYRMLTVLEQRGYVQKQAGTSAYTVSLKLFQLGHMQSGMASLRKALRLPMEQLANKIGEGCHFSIQYGVELLVMMERMPSRRICLAVGEGSLLALTQAASGNVLLGQLEADELEALLAGDDHYCSLSSAKKKKFLARIEQVREQGYELAQSQITPGVIDIALPIGIAGTDLYGALAVSQLGSDLNARGVLRNLREMQACSLQINQQLGIQT